MSRVHEAVSRAVAGWPIGLANLALTIASSAEAIEWYLSAVHDPAKANRVVRHVPLRLWLKMYRRRRVMWNEIGACFGIERAGMLISASNWIERASVEEIKRELEVLSPDEWRKAVAVAQAANRKWHASEIAMLDGQTEEGLNIDELLERPGIQFMLRVTIPMWVRFRRMPGELMRRARLGDLDALCDLLTIDKLAIADEGIVQALHEATLAKSPVRHRRIAHALASRSLGRFGSRRIKSLFAALISRFAERLGHRLTEPQIRRLFDAVARAGGDLRDMDLPGSSEALSKTIQRERPLWNIPDKSV